MNKPIRAVIIGNALEEFKKLNEIVGLQVSHGKDSTEEMQLLKSIKRKIEFIKLNPFYGENIQKHLIPKEYIIKHNVSNLFRTELSNFWRMIYTVKGDQIEIICFILDLISHPEYDNKFGYKKR
ncbi:MAG: hypothetical protein AABX10_04465 [Nanoarchaeota archaeon]